MSERPPAPGFTAAGDLDLVGSRRPGAVADDDGVRFEVWAPWAREVDIVIDPEGRPVVHAMTPVEGTADAPVWEVHVAGAAHGDRYRIRLDGEELADPASRHQPDGVFGPSAVVDPRRFTWHDDDWAGVSLADTVLYELHVGTFTPEGTLDAAIAELPRLAALGITTIELMPLAQFSGGHGWGYDGVFLAAVQHTYGGPEALARFVDAAHAGGLAVVIDVVYNHFGPEGDVTHRFGPYVTDTHRTPWGDAVNVAGPDSDQVRRFFVDTARLWIEDFHADGLRVDAVHAIVDPTARPFLEELSTAVHDLGRRHERTTLAFFESADNDPRMVAAPPAGLGADAVWHDEYHHGLRVAVTGDRSGYYADYRGASDVADVLEHGFTHRGRYSGVRRRRHGRDGSHLDANHFVVFGQNHDQIGNRRDGERLDVLVDHERRKLVLAAVLLSPFTPMLFMGEEYGEQAPFPFFVDHSDPELREAVRRGRAEEFASFAWSGEPPDPSAPETFASAVLRPARAEDAHHQRLEALTTELLTHRRRLELGRPGPRRVSLHGSTVVLHRPGPPRSVLVLAFADEPPPIDLDGNVVVLDTAADRWGGPGAEPTPSGVTIPDWRPSPWSAVLAIG